MPRIRTVQLSLCAPSCHNPEPTIGASQTGNLTMRQSGSSPLPSEMKDGSVCCQLQDNPIRQGNKAAARNSYGLLIPVQAGYGYGGAQGFASIRPAYAALCLLSFQRGVPSQMHRANFSQVLGRHAVSAKTYYRSSWARCQACYADARGRVGWLLADTALCLPEAATMECQQVRGGIVSSMALQHNHSRIQRSGLKGQILQSRAMIS